MTERNPEVRTFTTGGGVQLRGFEMAIKHFTGPHDFLANTYACPVTGPEDSIEYPSSEHAFQAAKSEDMIERLRIGALPTWREAKTAGRALALRPDWELVKREVMLHIVLAKFHQNPALLNRLKATGNATLIEGNHHGDDYWGMVPVDGIYRGCNYLGQILMAVRMVLC